MAPGPRTRALTKDQIERLERFRRARHEGAGSGYSLPQLRSAMAMPFGFRTLGKALAGRPVLDLHHSRIVEWIDRFLPVPPVHDGKMAAAGRDNGGEEEGAAHVPGKGSVGKEEDAEETPGATRTVRGSR